MNKRPRVDFSKGLPQDVRLASVGRRAFRLVSARFRAVTVDGSLIVAVAVICLALPTSAVQGAQPRGASMLDLARRAAGGDPGAAAGIESALEPFFTRKDLFILDSAAGAREILRVMGPGASLAAAAWIDPSGRAEQVRLLTIDFGPLVDDAAAGSTQGYVAYAIVQKGASGQPSVSWYHDQGKKVPEQGGTAWHPLAGHLLRANPGGGAGWTLVIEEAAKPAGPATGLLVLENRGNGWTATGRLAPASDARLVGVSEEGAVFLARRDPPKGVLAGAPPELFRSLIWFERSGGSFSQRAVEAPVPEPVTAAERLIAALRKGEIAEARRLSVSPDVLEAMLYFSPEWKGSGRIVRADAGSIEFVYEERERPTLRILLAFENRSGELLLSSATGRAEKTGP